MASVHTYKHRGNDVSIYGIDHSVGRGGVNHADDVQLIQILINRYIDWRAYAHTAYAHTGETRVNSRVLDKSGRQIDKLEVDGKCGPVTLAAIIATQKALNIWRGTAIDGRIDAFKDGSASLFLGPPTYGYLFSTMYILAKATDVDPETAAGHYAPPGTTRFDIFSLPEPLKNSLLRATFAPARRGWRSAPSRAP